MDKDRVLPFAADSRFFHKRAVRSMDKQDFLTALKHLKRALDMDPGSAEIALDLADTYARMGLYEMSNVELELLLGRQDCPEETQFAIGCNLMAMGDYAQAYVCFSAYLHDHPEGEFAYLAQDGIAQIEESEEEDGIDREQEALAEQGKAALDGGDAERAAEIFERVLALDPPLLYVRNNLALAYMCLQDSPNAWKQLNRILQTEANNTHACCNAALLMNNEGRADQAAAYMARLNPELMEELDELYKYCLTAAELRMQPELKQGLKKLLLLCPYETSMLYLYGVSLYNEGRWQEAARVLEKLLVVEPSNLPARDALALCHAGEESQRPKELPYSFEYTESQNRTLMEFLASLAALYPDAQAMRERLAQERELAEAALMGDDELVAYAMLVLTMAGGPLAEDLLRRLLLSMTHSLALKQQAAEALEQIDAPEPYLAYVEGRMVRMRKGQIKLKTMPPRPYAQFLAEMMRRMAETYQSEEAAAYGLSLWAAYLNSLDGRFPPFRDKSAWMAATRGRYEEDVLGRQPDLEALAAEEGCTTRTLTMRMRRLYAGSQELR